MSVTLGKGRVLLVEGPASVLVRRGEVTILGASQSPGKRIVVRRGKSLPFQALQDSLLELVEGEGSTKTEFPTSTIPEPWQRAAEEISSQRLSPVLVLGATDRGKNTFSLYLSNIIQKRNGTVVLIDGDVGQGDIGPPGCLSMASLPYPVFDLFALRPEATIFIGSTTPSGVQARISHALSVLRRQAEEKGPSLLLVNTDGWVFGDDAVDYKLGLLSSVAPRAVVGIQLGDELEPVLSKVERIGYRVLRVEPSTAARPRDRDLRRSLREQCYRKFLSGAAPRRFLVRRLKLECTFLGSPQAEDALRDRLSSLMNRTVLAFAGPDGNLRLFVESREGIDEQIIHQAVEMSGRSVRVVGSEEAKGLLLCLMNGQGRSLGLGILEDVDLEELSITVLTPCPSAPDIIRFGRIMLDNGLHEIGFTEALEP